jgi:hypothetical protein
MPAGWHWQLVLQHDEFQVLGELGLPTPNGQPQNSREHQVSKGEQHRLILPRPTLGLTTSIAGGSRTRRSGVSGIRARACQPIRRNAVEIRRNAVESGERRPTPSGDEPYSDVDDEATSPPLFAPGIGVLTPFTIFRLPRTADEVNDRLLEIVGGTEIHRPQVHIDLAVGEALHASSSREWESTLRPPQAPKKEAERPALVLVTRRLAGGQKTLIPWIAKPS